MATIPKKPDLVFPQVSLEGLQRGVKPTAPQTPSAEEIQADKARQRATKLIRERIYTQFPDLKPAT